MIAVALVLCAVFVPCAFISGITGRFFKQFAVTIAASTAISAINSLTLEPGAVGHPVAAAPGVRKDPLTWLINAALGWFFRLFNVAFGTSTAGYTWMVGRLVRLNLVVLLVYGLLLALTVTTFRRRRRVSCRSRIKVESTPPFNCPTRRRCSARASARADRQDCPIRKGVAHTLTLAGFNFPQRPTVPTSARCSSPSIRLRSEGETRP